MKRNAIIKVTPDREECANEHLVQAPVQLVVIEVVERSPQVSDRMEIEEKVAENRVEIVSNERTPAPADRLLNRLVVGALSLTLLCSIGGAIWLQANDKEIPEILIASGTGALGGLVGLSRTSAKKRI